MLTHHGELTPFERLLTSDDVSLANALQRAAAGLRPDEAYREALASRLGVNETQLVCAIGFNAQTVEITGVAPMLGFGDWDSLVDERNFQFINDVYGALSIDNVVEIYRVLGDPEHPHGFDCGDLILTRLGNIESQIESTINPVMLSSYKLEIRGIYQNHLASQELVETRLRPEYGTLRSIADEIIVLAHSGAVVPARLLELDGVSPEEKSRLLFHELVTGEQIEARIASTPSDREREVLSAALANTRA